MVEAQITAWLLRTESALLALAPAAGFCWDDAPEPLDPQVIARRGGGEAEYNTWGAIDLLRTKFVFECYAGQKLDTVGIAAALLAEVEALRGGDVYWTMFEGMPDRGFHRETARYRRDVEFEIVHKGGS
ncbi:MAG: hypothetical protein R6W76_19485 [Caldilinea sp.]